MKKVIYTSENPVRGEMEKIVSLFESGADYLYLRKPAAGIDYWMAFLEQFPPGYESKMITTSYRLLHDLQLGGFHFQREMLKYLSDTDLNDNLKMIREANKISSVTVHDIDTLQKYDGRFDLILVAPLFESISKKEYKGTWDIEMLKKYNQNRIGKNSAIIALGGVNADKNEILQEIHVDGFALLGYLWEDPELAVENFKKMIS